MTPFTRWAKNPVLLLLPAPDFYSKDITQRTHSPRLLGFHSALHVRIPEHGWTAALLSTHSPCLQADYLLPLPKTWRGKKDQQDTHVDCKAPASQATLDSLLYLLSSCIWPPRNTKSLTITAAVMNQTEACSNWLKPDMSRLLFIDPIKCQPN